MGLVGEACSESHICQSSASGDELAGTVEAHDPGSLLRRDAKQSAELLLEEPRRPAHLPRQSLHVHLPLRIDNPSPYLGDLARCRIRGDVDPVLECLEENAGSQRPVIGVTQSLSQASGAWPHVVESMASLGQLADWHSEELPGGQRIQVEFDAVLLTVVVNASGAGMKSSQQRTARHDVVSRRVERPRITGQQAIAEVDDERQAR